MLKLFEKFAKVDVVKETIMVKAVETGNEKIVDFFLNKGYKVTVDVLNATGDGILRYLLSKKIDIEQFRDDNEFLYIIKNEEVQKALIDFDYEHLIYSTVGFNSRLKFDPKYSDIIDSMENANKYNM